MAYSMFPDETGALIEALRSTVSTNIIRRNIAAVRWWIVYYYLQGYRNIEVSSWQNAVVNVSFEDLQGELRLTYEDVLDRYRKEVGRLLAMDLEPVALRGAEQGLGSVREAGAAQAILAHMHTSMSSAGRQQEKMRVAETAVAYGTGALHHYRATQYEDIGERTRREVVPPWELMPLCGEVFSLAENRGDLRHRWVPLEWAREQEHLKKAFTAEGATDAALGVREFPFGTSPMRGGPTSGTSSGSGFGGGLSGLGGGLSGGYQRRDAREEAVADVSKSAKQKAAARGDRSVKWIELSEAYERPEGDEYMTRYIAWAGDVIGPDYRYEGRAVAPLAVFRYVSAGGYYGRSFVDMLLPLNYEIEKMLASAIQNVNDFDIHGMTIVPLNAGISKTQFQTPERRKVLFYEPDINFPDLKVENIAPANSRDWPLKTIGAVEQLQGKLSGQTPLMSGESIGRFDSAAAAGYLKELGDIGIVTTMHSIADAYVQTFASMLQAAQDEAEDGEQSIPIPALDSRMLGVVMDIKDGTIDLRRNPVPDPWSVRLDVAERAGRSKAQMKQEAGLLLQTQAIDLVEFRIMNEKEGLGFPLVFRTEYEQWRRAVLTKLIVFNDGETPGRMPLGIGTPEYPGYENPDIVLSVLDELMQSVEFVVASEAVRTAFVEIRAQYEGNLGSMPDALPSLMEAQAPQPGAAGAVA